MSIQPNEIIIQHHGHLYRGTVWDYINLCGRKDINPDGSEDNKVGLPIATADDLVEYNHRHGKRRES